MFASQFVSVTAGFSDRQRQAAELLIAGVAFQKDGKTWDVISHEGDQIGTMSTFIVCETSHMLKKAGLKLNNSIHYQGLHAHPCPPFPGAQVATFAHNNFPGEEIQRMMDRRFKRPLTLM
jgi:hypothetical protein